jgi:hypothetical protein
MSRQELYADQRILIPIAIVAGCFITGAVLAVAGRAGLMVGVAAMNYAARRADPSIMRWANITDSS